MMKRETNINPVADLYECALMGLKILGKKSYSAPPDVGWRSLVGIRSHWELLLGSTSHGHKANQDLQNLNQGGFKVFWILTFEDGVLLKVDF